MRLLIFSILLLAASASLLLPADEWTGVWDARSDDIPDIARICLTPQRDGSYLMEVWSPYVGEDPETGEFRVHLYRVGHAELVPVASQSEGSRTAAFEAEIPATKPVRSSKSGPTSLSPKNYSKTFSVMEEDDLLVVLVHYRVQGFPDRDRRAVTRMQRREPLVFRIGDRRIRFRTGERIWLADNGLPILATLYEETVLRVGETDIRFKPAQIEFREDGGVHWGWLARDTVLQLRGDRVTVPAGNIVVFDEDGVLIYYGTIPPWAHGNGA